MQHIRIDINGLPLELIRPASIISQRTNNSSDITSGQADCFTAVKRLNCGKQLRVFLGNVCKLVEKNTGFMSGDKFSSSFESPVGGGHSKVDVLFGAFADERNSFFGTRIKYLELSLFNSFNPFTVNTTT
ncbi:hypothetical protein FOMG_17148 [Fusarium oxysporum f. sp. melonis 26406]|uniref:Uncharacterized protein n=1 Tax=Fusarium oxysporum f. sp. melonis 26406 TaxID=1089452 RepID=W9ZYT5_FUSOX|nr:hypothetical protein FOMG_17148 [Fusarium oxysporum f. sp. melonis 26406]